MDAEVGRGAPASCRKASQSVLPQLLVSQQKTEIQIHNMEPFTFKVSVYPENTGCGSSRAPEGGQGFVSGLFPAVSLGPRTVSGAEKKLQEDLKNLQGPISDCKLPGARGAAVPTLCRQDSVAL